MAPHLPAYPVASTSHAGGQVARTWASRISRRLKASSRVLFNNTSKHTGVGIVCAVAYFDP